MKYIKRIVKKIINSIKILYKKKKNSYLLKRVYIENIGAKINTTPKGYILVSYITPSIRLALKYEHLHKWDRKKIVVFFNSSKTKNLLKHTMYWESVEIVRLCIERGYIVDIIDDRYGYLLEDTKKYTHIIDEYNNFENWSIPPETKRLFYCTGSHYLTQNTGEILRIYDLYHRHGKRIKSQRQFVETSNDEFADYITVFGNDFQKESFSKLNRSKIRKIYLSSTEENLIIEDINIDKAKQNYLWFGGGGWVHKGLDLTIEYFLENPNFTLHIVGKKESDIEKIYGDALTKSKNIKFYGFLDISSDTFYNVLANCIAVIYPSVSEGCSGAIVQCMHHGLIPIVSKATGLEAESNYLEIKGTSTEEIKNSIDENIKRLTSMDKLEICKLAKGVYNYSNTYHTKLNYTKSLEVVLDEFLI